MVNFDNNYTKGLFIGSFAAGIAGWAVGAPIILWGVILFWPAVMVTPRSVSDKAADQAASVKEAVVDKAVELKEAVVNKAAEVKKQAVDVKNVIVGSSLWDKISNWLYTPTLKEFAVFSVCMGFIVVMTRIVKRWSRNRVTKQEVGQKLDTMWKIVDYLLAAAVTPVILKYGMAGGIRMFGYLRQVAFYVKTLFAGASFIKRELIDEEKPDVKKEKPGIGFVYGGTLAEEKEEKYSTPTPEEPPTESFAEAGTIVAEKLQKKLEDPAFQQAVTAMSGTPMTADALHEEVRKGFDAIEAQAQANELQILAEAAIENDKKASSSKKTYAIVATLILVLIAIVGMTWYIMHEEPKQEEPKSDKQPKEAKKQKGDKEAKKKPICELWSKTGKCPKDGCDAYHPKAAWKPLCDNPKCTGPAKCGKHHAFRKHKVESTTVSGCVHAVDCPMKLKSDASKPCKTVCNGHHCTHFVECDPQNGWAKAREDIAKSAGQGTTPHSPFCCCVGCVQIASEKSPQPKLTMAERAKSAWRRFKAKVGLSQEGGIIRKVGRRFYVQYEVAPDQFSEEYPISARRARHLFEQDQDFSLVDEDDNMSEDSYRSDDEWRGADEGDLDKWSKKGGKWSHKESRMTAPRVRADPTSFGCVVVKSKTETRGCGTVYTHGTWQFAAHILEGLVEPEVVIQTLTEDIKVNLKDIEVVKIEGQPIDLAVLRNYKPTHPRKSLRCVAPTPGEPLVMLTLDAERLMHFSYGVAGDMVSKILFNHKVTTDDGDCTGCLLNQHGQLVAFHIIGGPNHNTAIAANEMVNQAIIKAVAGNQ